MSEKAENQEETKKFGTHSQQKDFANWKLRQSLWQTQNFAAQSRRQAQNCFKIFNLLAPDIIQKVV